jgi:hypothetical protein
MIKLNGGYTVSITMLSAIVAAVNGCSGEGSPDESESVNTTENAVATTNNGASDKGPRPGPAGAGAPLAAQPIDPDNAAEQAIAAAACFPACAAGTTGPQPCISNPNVLSFCKQAVIRFQEIDSVSGTGVSTGIPGFIKAGTPEPGVGLGPTFNNVGCHVCHSQPGVLGSGVGMTSPQFPGTPNPQVALAKLDGASNILPTFITPTTPIVEVRFKSDGGVHDLFTVAGRGDAKGCGATQPAYPEVAFPAPNNPTISFRIPLPTFGDGLVELIPEAALEANLAAASCGSPTLAANAIAAGAAASTGAAGGATPNTGGGGAVPALGVNSALPTKSTLGISGTFNRSGNDGTITRFGWKAQNKSLLMFAGEAYNVEQGVTNLLFPDERPGGAGNLSACMTLNGVPEDQINFAGTLLNGTGVGTVSDDHADTLNFAQAMALSRPPAAALPPGGTLSQAFDGLSQFVNVGCAHCHTPSFTTGPSSADPGLSNVTFFPFSDFAIHNMGTGLSDGITQGNAGPQQFRTAPLWGVGQRLFFLHDGRASDLVTAIAAHSSSGSEANTVISRFNALNATQQQDVLYFLRAL